MKTILFSIMAFASMSRADGELRPLPLREVPQYVEAMRLSGVFERTGKTNDNASCTLSESTAWIKMAGYAGFYYYTDPRNLSSDRQFDWSKSDSGQPLLQYHVTSPQKFQMYLQFFTDAADQRITSYTVTWYNWVEVNRGDLNNPQIGYEWSAPIQGTCTF